MSDSETKAATQTSILKHRLNFKDIARRLFFMTSGAVLVALGLEGILIPNHIIDGGVTGIALILNHLTPVSLSIFLLILNLPFFIIGYKLIGKSFALSMSYGIIILSIATSRLYGIEPFVDDSLLAVVFGGICLGVGVGLVMRSGGVLDGTECLAILLDRKTPFSVGEIIMVINVFIFTIAAFVFGLENALYSMLTYYVASKTIDTVVQGVESMECMYIISNHTDAIVKEISDRLNRGSTLINAEGTYSGSDKKMILVAFTRFEESTIRDIIREIDPSAFIILSHVADVKGGRFKKGSIH